MMTVKEIEAEMAALEAQREHIKAKLRALESQRNQALAAAELAAMPEAKRNAIILAARGIEPTSKVGTPGR